ncbi:MAG: hypothetical protein ABGX68_09030 [Methylococcales bacterium]
MKTLITGLSLVSAKPALCQNITATTKGISLPLGLQTGGLFQAAATVPGEFAHTEIMIKNALLPATGVIRAGKKKNHTLTVNSQLSPRNVSLAL